MSSVLASTLQLPVTGQTLRQAVEAGDMHTLLRCAASLRVAGYQVDPQRLVSELLQQGCTWVIDAFGHAVILRVSPGADAASQPPSRPNTYRLAA